MHYAIFNSSGNALEWFTDIDEARRALEEMRAEFPDADVDLIGFARMSGVENANVAGQPQTGDLRVVGLT